MGCSSFRSVTLKSRQAGWCWEGKRDGMHQALSQAVPVSPILRGRRGAPEPVVGSLIMGIRNVDRPYRCLSGAANATHGTEEEHEDAPYWDILEASNLERVVVWTSLLGAERRRRVKAL